MNTSALGRGGVGGAGGGGNSRAFGGGDGVGTGRVSFMDDMGAGAGAGGGGGGADAMNAFMAQHNANTGTATTSPNSTASPGGSPVPGAVGVAAAAAAAADKRKKTTKFRDGSTPERLPFVTATFEMVSSRQPEDCVGWGPDGATLEIRKIGPFCEHVLPRYFSHSNLSSFVRQLNMYGFQKVECRAGVTHSFKHESFLRDRADLLTRLTRKVNLGKKRERDYDDPDDSGGGGPFAHAGNGAAAAASGGNGGASSSAARARLDKSAELEMVCRRLEEENVALMAELVKAKQQIQRLEAERGQYLMGTAGRNVDAARKVQSFFGFNPNEKIDLEDTSLRKFDSNNSFTGMMETGPDPFSSVTQLQARTNSLAGLASVAHGLASTITFPSIAGFQSAFSMQSMSAPQQQQQQHFASRPTGGGATYGVGGGHSGSSAQTHGNHQNAGDTSSPSAAGMTTHTTTTTTTTSLMNGNTGGGGGGGNMLSPSSRAATDALLGPSPSLIKSSAPVGVGVAGS